MSHWVQCTVYISKIVLVEVKDTAENPEATGVDVVFAHYAENHDEIENVQLIMPCDVERSKQLANQVILLTNEGTSA